MGCALVPEGRQLFAPLSVRENLLLGAYTLLKRGRTRRDAARDIDAIFERFPQLKLRQRQSAGTLSGGEQQMLAVGRALMAKPRLMMMDEPSMGLAPMMVRQILAAVSELRASGVTVLLVEQNARAALAVADRGYVLETGHVLLEGSADDLMHSQDVQRAYLGRDFRSIAE